MSAMKTLLICTLCFVVALSSACRTETLVTKVDPNNPGTQRTDGVLFSLPETVVVAEVPLTKTASSPGGFHEWTAFFYPELTSDNYTTEEKTSFKVGAPTFTTRGQTDPNNVYMAHIKAKQFETKTLLVEFNDDGIIARTETSSKNETIDIVTSGLKTVASIAAPLLHGGMGADVAKSSDEKEPACLEAEGAFATARAAAKKADQKALASGNAADITAAQEANKAAAKAFGPAARCNEQHFKKQLSARELALYESLDDSYKKFLRENFGYEFLTYLAKKELVGDTIKSANISFFLTLNEDQQKFIKARPRSADACPWATAGKCMAMSARSELIKARAVFDKIQQLRLTREELVAKDTPAAVTTSANLEQKLKELDSQINITERSYFLGTSSETTANARFEFKPSSLFAPGDFVSGMAFAVKLNAQADQVSAYLHSKLTAPTLALLAADVGTQTYSAQLNEALVIDLNPVLAGSALADMVPFAGVGLRAETKQLQTQNPKGQDLVLLNRMTLEDAYPSDITRNRIQNAFSYASGGNKPGICGVTTERPGLFRALWPKNLAGECHGPGPQFVAGDFHDLKKLKDRLSAAAAGGAAALADPVSAYVFGQLTGPTQGWVNAPAATPQEKSRLRNALIADLNLLVAGVSIYNAAAFAEVNLSSDSIKLLATPGADVAKLNRLLLEDAYPKELYREKAWTSHQIAMVVDAATPGIAQTVRTASLTESGKRGFPYRVPASTVARLTDDGIEKGRSDVRVAQFGPVQTLPANLGGRRSSYKITYYDASGAIKVFDMSADALIQKSNVTDLTDAATTLRDAEAARLARETDLLTKKKAKLDAENALKEAQGTPTPTPSPE